MLEELRGKEVLILMGSASIVTDSLKGKVLDVGETWIKLQTKKKIAYINLAMVGRITTNLE